ncbi:hypothetical protein [Enterococcus faecalis]
MGNSTEKELAYELDARFEEILENLNGLDGMFDPSDFSSSQSKDSWVRLNDAIGKVFGTIARAQDILEEIKD